MIKDSKINPVYIMTNHIQANSNSGLSPISTNRNPRPLRTALRRFAAVAALLLGIAMPAVAQTNYVFYNSTYGYLYNDNGTTKAGDLRFDKSSAWIASGSIGGTSRTIRSYTSEQYLGANASLSNSSSNWRGNNNYLCYRTGGTNYYLKATNATTFTTNSNQNNGERFSYYTVTIYEGTESLTDFTINSGVDNISQTGNQNYGHSNVQYTPAYTDYYFSNTHHYIGKTNNTLNNVNATNVTTGYTWTLSDNATGYATVNSSGTVNVSTIPNSDITITLTCSLTYEGITKTATKDITIIGANPSAPIISVNGSTVTLTTNAAGSTSIRYTTNGNDPTANTGTVYSNPFDVGNNANSPVIIKAVTVRNGNASDVAEATVKLTLPEPTITINGEAKTATINCSNAGATIYYTTDGSTPSSTNGSQYTSSLTGLSYMTTIKAIAIKDGWNDSPVASDMVTISSGSSGGTVTLFDYEDHNWTYYSGVSSSVDGGNYNTNYSGKMYSPNPRNVKITYKANGGQVSIDESETEFVYYKTLEQGTTAGEYPYKVISNPFSKRPNGKGFGGWEITGGADYIQGHSANDILSLDEDIVFTNLPYPSVNCTSAEIELTATWVNLNDITYANGNTVSYSVSGGTYETNILVLNRNVTGTITASSPVTIMMVEPDGSSDYRNSNAFTGNISPSNNGVTKIEFAKWNSTNTVNANYKHLWIGRGMTTTSQCATLITGTTSTNSTASPKYSIKLESGKFTYVSFFKGYYNNQSAATDAGFRVSGSGVNAVVIYGNDYDRAKGTNTNLVITEGSTLGLGNSNYAGFTDRSNRDNMHTLDMTIKSGSIGSNYFIENTTNSGYLQGGDYNIYLCSGGTTSNMGCRNLTIEGGDVCSIGGGADQYNNAPSNSDTYSTTTNYNRTSINIRVKGGTVHGNIFGGGAWSPSGGNKVIVLTGGKVTGWVAAGCNGVKDDGGQNYGASFVYVGGNAEVNSNNSNKVLGYANGGNVYAAGAGLQGAENCGEMTFGTNLAIADNSFIERAAYGGGNYGYAKTSSSTNIYITGGTVGGKDDEVNNVTSKGAVFGGSNQQDGPNVNIYMTGGNMQGGVYGGCNTKGTISGNVTMKINGGQVGTNNTPANIHGGGYGKNTVVSNNIDLTLGLDNSAPGTPGVIVYGDVYGGSALGSVNGTSANTTYHTNVTLNAGKIYGSLYGGALGDGSTAANVYAPVTVTVNGGSVKKTSQDGSGAVYGCNNVNGAPQRSVAVVINGTDPADGDDYALYAVYGGGNKASYTYTTPTVTVNNCENSIEYVYGGGNAASVPSTNVKIYGGNTIGTVFGGGNGTVTAANVTNNTSVNIYGGTIGRVFGGSNSQGTIGGTISVNVVTANTCLMHIGELYGGGNMAPSNAGSISIGCMGDNDMIDYVYGGANQANIGTQSSTSNISLSITGGRIGNLFGGNNQSGTIYGNISINVNWDGSCDNSYLGNVFGGGNHAAYSGTPSVTITNGTVSHNVYGGGNEAGVAGGSVTMNGGAVLEGIYGGCNTSGTVSGAIAVTINAGTVGTNATQTANVHGGGYGQSTATGNDVTVTIGNGTSAPVIWGDVYGGSALGNVNANTNQTTKVWLKSGTVNGCLYGGGLGDASNAALVNGKVQVIVDGGYVKSTTNTTRTTGNVFGCNNVNGTPKGTVEVQINTTAASTGSGENKAYALQGVYGGGNLAHYNPASTSADYPKVTVACGTSVKDVYGGGNAAAVPNTNVIIEGGDIDRVFAGGNGESGTPANVGYMTTSSSPSSETQYGTGNAKAVIKGGTINQIFGGSNANGVIRGTMNVNVDRDASCATAMVIKEIYGGGNLAASKSGSVTIDCTGTSSSDYIDYVYGGANQADITGNITLNITGGRINNVFGGNNYSGDINGSITVNVDWSQGSCTDNYVGNVFGGGNLAPYSVYGYDQNGPIPSGTAVYSNPAVNIKNATVSHSVYGGGKGSSAIMYGNPVVTIGDATAAHCAIVTENVYGGGDAAAVTGNTTVVYNDNNASSTVDNLFGGGNAAGVSGTATVTLTSGKVLTGVYGGCNASGKVGGAIALNINGGTVGTSANSKAYGIFGGGKGSATQTGDAVTVTIGTAPNAQTYPTIYGDVYGGSAEGQVNDALAEITSVLLNKGVIDGDIYGGGFGDHGSTALVNGRVQVVVEGGTVTGNIYGCNNAKGTPKGSVSVSINGSAATQDDGQGNKIYALQGVYGGGNLAHYDPTDATNSYPTVTISGCGTSVKDVYGGGNAAAVPRTYVVINGGDIDRVFAGGNGESGTPANVGYMNTDHTPTENSYGPGTANADIKGGTINEIFGGSNSKGTIRASGQLNIARAANGTCNLIIGDLYGGGNQADGAASAISIGCTGTNQGEGITNVFGGANAANVSGNISLTIQEGKIQNVYGGNNSTGSISGNIIVNIEQKDNPCTWYVGNVYGGGKDAPYTNSGADYPQVNIKKGTVTYNVFGGGYGSTATVTANPHVNLIGGTVLGNVFGGGEAAPVTGNPVVTANFGQAANLYGGGLGSTAVVTGNPSVLINQEQNKTLTVTDAFGGGDAAAVSGNTTVTLTTGAIRNIYGGGNMAGVTQATVNINGGSVTTGVYGGCNEQGTVTGDIAVSVTGGTIGTNASHANVHGGGYGAATRTNGNVAVTINGSGVNIWGDVYGGSALGNVNDATTDLTAVTLTSGAIHGSLYGGGLGQKPGVNGAANDATPYAALVNGAVNVIVNGGTVSEAVYGANNANGTPKGTVSVVINGTAAHVAATESTPAVFALNAVYGGGNLADCEPTATVTINGTSSVKDVYGGGNAAAVSSTSVTVNGGTMDRVFAGGNGQTSAANVTGNTQAIVHGGTIRQLFGGGNTSGTIGGTMSVTIDKVGNGAQSIAEVYGGGNLAPSGPGTVRILCGAEHIGDVYGGANNANISGNILLNIEGGQINRVFGGNNTGSNITGSITVNIDVDPTCTTFSLNNVYGGGNQAAYTPNTPGSYPAVNIKRGTISGNVFGGGLGNTAIVTSNPTVTVTGGTIGGSLFGGGDAAAVAGNTVVLINGSGAIVNTKVFGGGNNAGVSGNTSVTLANGIVSNNNSVESGIYGGCNTSGTISGNTSVAVTGGTVGTTGNHANIHGGGFGVSTAVSGDVTVNIGSVTGSGNSAVYSGNATIYGDVYGGSALGTVNTNHSGGGTYNKTSVNLYAGTIDGNVYGGGLGDASTAALVYGDVDVFQYGVALKARYNQGLPSSGMIFGCNNINGTPKGHVTVGVYKTTGMAGQQRSSAADRATDVEGNHTYELAAVYGGGNKAAYVPDDLINGSTEVFVNGCDEVSIHSVYGGGNAASTPATDVRITGAYEIEYVFGGGNGAGDGNPGANVGYHAYDAADPAIGGPSDEAKAARQQFAYGSGKAKTEIFGGRLHKVFGGSNTRGNVREATVAMLDEQSSCQLVLDGFYGGGKSAYMEGEAEIELGCISGLEEIYGGAEQADVGSHIVLTLTSGHYGKVYGGNNLGGKIMGSITVNIEQTGCLPVTIGELYLGGHNAAYSVYGYKANGTIIESGEQNVYPDPVLNLKSFKSIGSVFGGGEGADAIMVGNPTINVNVATGWVDGQYRGHGEGDTNSGYQANPQDLTPDGTIGAIFGGGNAAKVIGSTHINIADQSTVTMHSLEVLRDKIKASELVEDGKHYYLSGGMKFELSDDEKTIKYTKVGDNSPSLQKTIIQTVNGATISGNVYGGGNEAEVTGGTNIKVGPEGTPQQVTPTPSPAPARPQQPQTQQPTAPQSNAATESQQTRTANTTRL